MPNFSYAFSAGPARFRALNTNCRPLHLPEPDDEPEGAAPWTFLFGHHTVYGTGHHGDTDWLSRRQWERNAAPRADFYLSGHDHHLEHLRGPGGTTDYVVSGSGGRHWREAAPDAGQPSAAESLFSYRDNGLVGFEVTPGRVQVRYYDAKGEVLYGFVREKP